MCGWEFYLAYWTKYGKERFFEISIYSPEANRYAVDIMDFAHFFFVYMLKVIFPLNICSVYLGGHPFISCVITSCVCVWERERELRVRFWNDSHNPNVDHMQAIGRHRLRWETSPFEVRIKEFNMWFLTWERRTQWQDKKFSILWIIH